LSIYKGVKMHKKISAISRWFLAILAVLCAAAAGLALHVILQPVRAVIPSSNCPELMRMYPGEPPAHVVIKCKGLV
jgi:hypothetical protein